MWNTDANLNKYFSNESFHANDSFPAAPDVTAVCLQQESRPEFQSPIDKEEGISKVSFCARYLDQVESRLPLRWHQDNVVPGGIGWVAKVVKMFDKQDRDNRDEKEREMAWKKRKDLPDSPQQKALPVVGESRTVSTFPKNIFSTSFLKGHHSMTNENQPNVIRTPTLADILDSKRRLKSTRNRFTTTTTEKDLMYQTVFPLEVENEAQNDIKPCLLSAGTSIQASSPKCANKLTEVTSPTKSTSGKVLSPSKLFPALLSKTKSLLDVGRTFSKKSSPAKTFLNDDKASDRTFCWSERECSLQKSSRDKQKVPRKSWSAMDMKFKCLDDSIEDDYCPWVPETTLESKFDKFAKGNDPEMITKLGTLPYLSVVNMEADDSKMNPKADDPALGIPVVSQSWTEILRQPVDKASEKSSLETNEFVCSNAPASSQNSTNASESEVQSKTVGKRGKSWFTRWSLQRKVKTKDVSEKLSTENNQCKTPIKEGNSNPKINTGTEVDGTESKGNKGKSFVSRTYSKVSFL